MVSETSVLKVSGTKFVVMESGILQTPFLILRLCEVIKYSMTMKKKVKKIRKKN